MKFVNILAIILLLVSCSPDEAGVAPPANEPNASADNKPALPNGPDYSKPGSLGKFGVDKSIHTNSPEIEDEAAEAQEDPDGYGWMNIYNVLEGDPIRPKVCPVNPIYVADSTGYDCGPNCVRNPSYFDICKESLMKVAKKTHQAIKSCERLPSCNAEVVQAGQLWECGHDDAVGPVETSIGVLTFPERWEKICSTQIKIVCVSL